MICEIRSTNFHGQRNWPAGTYTKEPSGTNTQKSRRIPGRANKFCPARRPTTAEVSVPRRGRVNRETRVTRTNKDDPVFPTQISSLKVVAERNETMSNTVPVRRPTKTPRKPLAPPPLTSNGMPNRWRGGEQVSDPRHRGSWSLAAFRRARGPPDSYEMFLVSMGFVCNVTWAQSASLAWVPAPMPENDMALSVRHSSLELAVRCFLFFSSRMGVSTNPSSSSSRRHLSIIDKSVTSTMPVTLSAAKELTILGLLRKPREISSCPLLSSPLLHVGGPLRLLHPGPVFKPDSEPTRIFPRPPGGSGDAPGPCRVPYEPPPNYWHSVNLFHVRGRMAAFTSACHAEPTSSLSRLHCPATGWINSALSVVAITGALLNTPESVAAGNPGFPGFRPPTISTPESNRA